MRVIGILLGTALAVMPLAGLSQPSVVTDIAPVASLVAQVMGDAGEPDVLVEAGSDGHHHQLRPSEARRIANADLLVWIGPALTPWLEGASRSLVEEKQLVLLDVPKTLLRAVGHADDASHDHGPVDPHAWLAPENAVIWLDAIAAALSKADPDNAGQYTANAAAAADRIRDVSVTARSLFQDADPAPFVVPHDAYGYFTSSMGLPDALAVGDLSDNAPSAAGLRLLHKRVSESGAVCFHPEAGGGDRQMAAVQDLGLKQGADLDPTGMNQGDLDTLYTNIISSMSQAIAHCSGG